MVDKKSTVIDILQVMHIVDKMWRNLTKTTIVNCFRSYGFVLEVEKDDTLLLIIENTDTDDREWVRITSRYGISEENFDDYVEIDNDVTISGIPTDNNITDSIRGTEDVDDVKEALSKPTHRVSMKQAAAALILLRTFTEQLSNVDHKVNTVLNVVENTIDNSKS
jgi:hypothetical protein